MEKCKYYPTKTESSINDFRYGCRFGMQSTYENRFEENNLWSNGSEVHMTRSIKTALKELDDVGLLVRRSGGFSKPNHLYVKIPSDEIGLQPVDDKAVEKMTTTESEKQPSSSCKNGCAGVGNVAPSKVTEKYKSNKYHEVNYCYGEGESL